MKKNENMFNMNALAIVSTLELIILIFAGPELNEPIKRYWPFAMNTKEKIHQAFSDYQNGTFFN